MIHKIRVFVIRRFVKKAQAWVDKTPGAVSVSIDTGDRIVVIAEKKRKKC